MAAVMEPSWPGKSTLARVRAPRHPATSARRSSHYARAAHRQQAEMQLCILGDNRVSSFSERTFDRHTPLQGPADLYHADCAHGIA
jgi:hypothetical protein